jgi:DNA-directed RNA polymerase II subunit RPB2
MDTQMESKSERKMDNSIDYSKYVEYPWDVIKSYFEGKHLDQMVRHQIESFDDFATFQIPKTISMFNPVKIQSDRAYDGKDDGPQLEVNVTFDNFSVQRPQIHENTGAIKLMFPQEARLRNFTYAANMTVDMTIKYVIKSNDSEQTMYKKIPSVHIGKLPIMLKSGLCVLTQYSHVPNSVNGECEMDAGGYFIINGSEKTCQGQERAAENMVQCFNVEKNNNKWAWMAEIKSVPDFKCISPKQLTLYQASKNSNGFGKSLLLSIPRIKAPIPLFIVFRAIGVISDKDICQKIVLSVDDREELKENQHLLDALKASIVDASSHLTQEEALTYITSNAMYTPINMDKETGAAKETRVHTGCSRL